MYYLGSDNFDELEEGQIIVCTQVGTDSIGRLTVGNEYLIRRVVEDDIIVINDRDNAWHISIDDHFEVKKFSKFFAGDQVKCIDANGSSGALKFGNEHTIVSASSKSILVSGSDIRWRISRFEKISLSVGDKVTMVRASPNAEDWHPKINVEYVVKTIKGDKIGVILPASTNALIPEHYTDGTRAIWKKSFFVKVKEKVEVKEIKQEKIKLNAKKMHTHTCIKCAKSIFPKTLCKCPITLDIPS